MAGKIGLNAKLYYNTGTYATPTWSEITDAQDVTLDSERATAEVKRRGSQFVKYLTALKDYGVQFTLIYNPGNGALNALKDAYDNGAVVDVAVADGDIATSGTEYFRAEMVVSKFSINQPLEDVITVDVELKPAETDNDPQWVTVP